MSYTGEWKLGMIHGVGECGSGMLGVDVSEGYFEEDYFVGPVASIKLAD